MVEAFAANSAAYGFTAFPLGDKRQGIVHIVGPEHGITLPGLVIVCGDSHASTHGALGALVFGIGQSENEHVLATQAIWQAVENHAHHGRLIAKIEAFERAYAVTVRWCKKLSKEIPFEHDTRHHEKD